MERRRRTLRSDLWLHPDFGNPDYFDIDDPIYGKSHIAVSDFTNNYQGSGSWTHTYFTKSYICFMILNPLLLADEILRHIWEARPLLGVKAGLLPADILDTEGRTLGLAHPIFTLSLHDLTTEHAAPAQTGVRVLEFKSETPQAFYDLADAQTGAVQQMSAASPYLQLLPRALAAVSGLQRGETRYDLRLLRVPALNFEALWLHAGEGAEDQLVTSARVLRLRRISADSVPGSTRQTAAGRSERSADETTQWGLEETRAMLKRVAPELIAGFRQSLRRAVWRRDCLCRGRGRSRRWLPCRVCRSQTWCEFSFVRPAGFCR